MSATCHRAILTLCGCCSVLGCGDKQSADPTASSVHGAAGSPSSGDTTVNAAGSGTSGRESGGRGGAQPDDASRPDASTPDASQPDASTPDASRPDASTPDASRPDASTPDASRPDASTPDASTSDAASGEGGSGLDAAGDPDSSTDDVLQQNLIMPGFSSGVDGVELGIGRNDGTVRLYGPVSYEGSGYEWSYEDDTWVTREIYSGIGPHCTPRLGDLDGEGAKLHTGIWDDVGVGIVSYGTSWGPVTLVAGSSGKGRILAVRVGNGRNDGVERLYVASDGGFFEYSYDGSSYAEELLLESAAGDFGLGDGRNDGTTRIYVGERGGSRLHELTWEGAAFADDVVFDCGTPSEYAAHVGDGRGDGVQRVYAWCGAIHELAFEAGGWVQTTVDSTSGTRYYIRSGRVRSDGQSRLYVSQTPVGLAEYTWNADRQEFDVDVVSGATGGVAIGDGRGDGKNRLYVARGSNGAYGEAAVVEISSSDPPPADP